MIRLSLLWMLIGGLAVYAWRDWYRSLCGLVLLVAVIEHPDMPKSLFGVQGLNPWNILALSVILAWAVQRRAEGLTWDLPRGIRRLLLVYAGIVLVGFLRMLADWQGLNEYAQLVGWEGTTQAGLWSEFFFNTFKWVVPGLLFYDGCRSRERFHLGFFCLLSVYFLLAVQVIRWMPLDTITSGEALTERSLKILSNEVGFHRVNLSMMLAGASWAVFSAIRLNPAATKRLLILLAGVVICFGQALTGGRMGYVTWGAVGVVLGVVRWRKLLVAMPVLACVVLLVVPAARDRLLQGFSEETIDSNAQIEETMNLAQGETSWYTVTAGRNVAWPRVLEQIKSRPLVGYGREAMARTGVSSVLFRAYAEVFPHPHNAYLQWTLDNGLIGLVAILWLFSRLLKISLSLFRDSSDALYSAIGGAASALLIALLVASVGSQTFYPREGAVSMWGAIGLMLRVHVQRSRLQAGAVVAPDLFRLQSAG